MPIDFAWTHALRDSPIFMVLVGCSVITFGVACERLWYFLKRRSNPDALLRSLREAVRAGGIERARSLCATHPHPFAAVADRLLETNDADEKSAEERIQIALSEEKLLFERNLGLVATMAAVAPLIGLLGTVWGIMRAFADMARIGSASPSVVAAGVAEALLTTAAGLIIAVPAVIVYNHLTRRMNATLTVAENHARSLRTDMRDASRTNAAPSSPQTGEPVGRSSATQAAPAVAS